MSDPLQSVNQALFSNPVYTQVQVSPQAGFISYCHRQKTGTELILQSCDLPDKTFPVIETPHSIDRYWWLPNEHYLIYLENRQEHGSHLCCLDLRQQKIHEILSHKLIKTITLHPSESVIYLEMKDAREAYFHLFEYHIEQNQLLQSYHNQRYAELVWDELGQVSYAIYFDAHQAQLVALKAERHEIVAHLTQHDILSLHRFPELKPRLYSDILYFTSSGQSDTSQLYQYDNGHLKMLSTEDTGDLGDITSITWDENQNKPISYSRAYQRRKHYAIQKALQADFDILQKKLGPNIDFEIIANSQDNQHWVIMVHDSTSPAKAWSYQRKNQQLQKICDTQIKPEGFQAVETICVEIPTQDRQKYPAYFTKSPQEQAPCIILIHGGPHSREFWGWLPVHQWLAYLGYHSLSVNYRGSSGMGRKALESANGEWNGQILSDIQDAREWLLKQDCAREDQIILWGNSFGGYVTLMLLSLHPNHFRCGIDQMGPGDLEKMVDELPPGWAVNDAFLSQMIGVSDREDKKALRALSPIGYLQHMKHPLLMGYGERDPIIHPSQAIRIIEQLQQNQKNVTGVFFSKQGHQIEDETIRCQWHMLVHEFLVKSLAKKQSLPRHYPALMRIIDNLNLLKSE